MKRLKSFIDASVLICAAQGKHPVFEDAMKVLDDPRREYCSSPFIRLEVLPKAIHNRRAEEAGFYQAFFTNVTLWANDLDKIVDSAVTNAEVYGLSAMDALHVSAALSLDCDEIITAEKPSKPLFRVKEIKVRSIR